jgi:AcrR family transcriptional regulator
MPYSKEHKNRSKERILQCATELFARYGFDRVSIQEIMRRARMTHGAFYAHFESKENLFRASFLESLRRHRPARLAKWPFSIAHLTDLVAEYLSLGECDRRDNAIPGPESVLINEIGNDNPGIQSLYETSYQHLRKMLERRIIALSRLHKLPFAPDRELVAEKSRAIIASIVGAVAIARSIPSGAERQRILDAAQQQVLHILGISPSDLERELKHTTG